ncbi:MAG: hypothetical protein R3B96_25600 [Pirellulaceae bacterium]
MLANHDVSHKELLPGVFLAHDERFLHRFVLIENRLDLAGLDAIGADLHLMVDASREFNLSRVEPTSEIAGAVESARVGLTLAA